MSCYTSGDFKRYWEENMRALGFWVPSSSYSAAVGLTTLIQLVATAVETNPGATLAQALARSGAATIAGNTGALLASLWAGGAVGSMAVATGRSLSCGVSIADALWIARNDLKIYGSWLEAEYIRNPQLLKGTR